jgi:hypothetical protein
MQDSDDYEIPTKLEMFVSQVTRSGTVTSVGSVHAQSVRIPTDQMSYVQAIAKHSGMSINKTIVQLLEIAIDAAHQALPAKDKKAIMKLQGQAAVVLLAAGELETSGEV